MSPTATAAQGLTRTAGGSAALHSRFMLRVAGTAGRDRRRACAPRRPRDWAARTAAEEAGWPTWAPG